MARGAAGQEALVDPADLIAIGAHRRPMIVVVPEVVLLVLVVVARQAAPDDPLVEEADQPLKVARKLKAAASASPFLGITVMLRLRSRIRHIGYTD